MTEIIVTQHLKPFRGNLSDADIARLREFVEIVAAGGVTAAQARLGKGKSAISLGLTRLEERLGVKLVARNIVDQRVQPMPLPQRRVYAAEDSYVTSGLKTPLPSAAGLPGVEPSMEETPFGELVYSSRVVVEYSVERR